MDLDMLKEKWSEMDDRLSKVELLNKQALHELLTVKVNNNLHQLQIRTTIGLFVNLFVIAIMIPVLRDIDVLSAASVWSVFAVMGLGLAWQIYRTVNISKMDISLPTSNLTKMVLREKRAALIDKQIMLPMILLVYVLFFFFERSWIIERGRIVAAIILLLALIAIVTSSYIANYRKYNSFLKEIADQLKELED